MEKRAKLGIDARRGPTVKPIFVWEPAPDFCKPSEILNFYEALKYIDVISPNLNELFELFDPDLDISETFRFLSTSCDELLTKGFNGKTGAVVVRLGEYGCWIAQWQRRVQLPAYHGNPHLMNETQKENWINKVIDTTGAGNAFLGGFCIGLLNGPHPRGWTEFEAAAMYGAVAASFAVEQFGMPRSSNCPVTQKELWNGEAARDRLTTYEKRIGLSALSKEKLKQASLSNTTKNSRLV